jgi:hypothetical protein
MNGILKAGLCLTAVFALMGPATAGSVDVSDNGVVQTGFTLKVTGPHASPKVFPVSGVARFWIPGGGYINGCLIKSAIGGDGKPVQEHQTNADGNVTFTITFEPVKPGPITVRMNLKKTTRGKGDDQKTTGIEVDSIVITKPTGTVENPDFEGDTKVPTLEEKKKADKQNDNQGSQPGGQQPS